MLRLESATTKILYSIAAAAVVAAFLPGAGELRADTTIFTNIPGTLAPSYPSQAYEAQQTGEFGTGMVTASGGKLTSATVVLDTWAGENDSGVAGSSTGEQWDYETSGWCTANPGSWNSSGWNYPFTLSFYDVNSANPSVPGALIGSVTETQFVPWRPVATGASAGYAAYYTVNGINHYGYATPITFNLSSSGITVPSQFIMTLGFNTEAWGASPTSETGPYDSLNIATMGGVSTAPTVGSYLNVNDIYTDQRSGSDAYQPLAFGSGLNQQTGWTDYQPLMSVTATPEPTTLALFAIAGAGALLLLPRRKRQAHA